MRRLIDTAYPLAHFALRLLDPEAAHDHVLRRIGLLTPLLSTSHPPTRIDLAPAAGFDKNGVVPHATLAALGFTRATVGTVTYEPWPGNERPRIRRVPRGLVNRLGLPGEGAPAIAQRLQRTLPITVSVAPTPQSLHPARDVVQSIESITADRYELNISCPNTDGFGLDVYDAARNAAHTLYVKLSPDLSRKELDQLVDRLSPDGWVVSNTARQDDGGLSGDGLYARATQMQTWLADALEERTLSTPIVACGGINSVTRARERARIGNVTELQLYTGLVTEGPGLLTALRKAF